MRGAANRGSLRLAGRQPCHCECATAVPGDLQRQHFPNEGHKGGRVFIGLTGQIVGAALLLEGLEDHVLDLAAGIGDIRGAVD